MKKANTDTTYCMNPFCKKKCWRHEDNYYFDANEKFYWYTDGRNCIEKEEEN